MIRHCAEAAKNKRTFAMGTSQVSDSRFHSSATARRLSPWVLTLWVSFLLLSYLQPCCEALAAAIPHEHETKGAARSVHGDQPSDGVHRTTRAGLAAGDPDAAPHPRHCANSSNLEGSIAVVLIGSDPRTSDPDGAAPVLVSVGRFKCPKRIQSSERVERGRSPPNPVYLSTLRLRI